jgi:hypothetical protein
LSEYKSQCADIGFKLGTEKFGDCVLELKRRADVGQQSRNNNLIDPNVAALEQLVRESQNRMALERQQYQQQIQAQRAAQERARKQQFWGAVTQFGLGMATGQQPNSRGGNVGQSFQPIKPPSTMDGACHSGCMGLGYSYGLCQSKCSY